MVSVRATPRASRNTIQGLMATPDGLALKISVTAPADKGKANAAVTLLLAKAFGVAKSDIALTSGDTDRRKVFRINGDPAGLAATAQQWMTS
jgi:uncharacterized protein (TIGR00251 family)